MPEGWVHDEINAVVEAYFILLDRYQASQPLNKAQVIRILRQGPLFGRTGASISRKFENINAILKEHGSPRLPGHAADSVLSSGGKATVASCCCYAVLASSCAGSSSSAGLKSLRSDTSLM